MSEYQYYDFKAIDHALTKVEFQFVETLFPESAIADRPVADLLDRRWPERAHTLPSTLRLDHNPRPHQVGNMF